ncbi:MAG: hypothetical protein IPL73_06640 [Candidatus Obscuribacter sp.]|nr:hypothetical protein [Candidatus Obscuribacter sp.]
MSTVVISSVRSVSSILSANWLRASRAVSRALTALTERVWAVAADCCFFTTSRQLGDLLGDSVDGGVGSLGFDSHLEVAGELDDGASAAPSVTLGGFGGALDGGDGGELLLHVGGEVICSARSFSGSLGGAIDRVAGSGC